ncbi:MAG: hypothetical protein WD042_12055 [Phycisphaeraceae bacterium]
MNQSRQSSSRSSMPASMIGGAAVVGVILVGLLLWAVTALLGRPAGSSPAPAAMGASTAAVSPKAPLSLDPVGTPTRVPAGRSPLAQAGEDLSKPLPAEVLAPKSNPASNGSSVGKAVAEPEKPAVPGVIPYTEAGKYVGQEVTVEGRIVDTSLIPRDQVCFLNFEKYNRGSTAFYTIIFREAMGSWPQSPEKHFLNQTIRVKGKVFEHKGRAQIRVYDGSQIQIVE